MNKKTGLLLKSNSKRPVIQQQRFVVRPPGLHLIIFCLIFASLLVKAEFDPTILSQSTVRILIKNKQGVIGAASGFLWQTNTQIVTSLHVISSDPNSKIIVEFGRKKRKATVKAVLPKADLVLLTVNNPVKGWIPLSEFEASKPKYKDEVSALGFNSGSIAMSTRELRKGFVKPETLQVLLPPDALQSIVQTTQLNIRLPIYYLDGSLLPGYSGSPIVNSQGKLIGIGDGGLENGASSVSWVIPANNLTALVNSQNSQLPDAQDSLGQIFSVDKLTPSRAGMKNKLGRAGKPGNVLSTLLHSDSRNHTGIFPAPSNAFAMAAFKPPYLTNAYFVSPILMKPVLASSSEYPTLAVADELPPLIEVNYHQFNFVKTKKRSYAQLLSSSGQPAKMEQVFSIFNRYFYGYKVDFQSFVFDIYEDGRFGLNIAVPERVNLTVDDNFLLAQGAMFCRRCDYEIQYHARQLNDKVKSLIQKKPHKFLNKVADQQWQDLNQEGDYDEYEAFRKILSFGGDRYVLRAAFSDFSEPFKDQFEFNYFTAATNRNAWFQAQGILNRFDSEFFSSLDKYRETDCTSHNLETKRTATCRDIETMMKVLISVHLTSFSNQHFDLNFNRLSIN